MSLVKNRAQKVFLVPKLTDGHVYPEKMKKMSHAAYVFSNALVQ